METKNYEPNKPVIPEVTGVRHCPAWKRKSLRHYIVSFEEQILHDSPFARNLKIKFTGAERRITVAQDLYGKDKYGNISQRGKKIQLQDGWDLKNNYPWAGI